MIRDRRMQLLIAKNQEPITPFIDKVRQLYTDYGVSTILAWQWIILTWRMYDGGFP